MKQIINYKIGIIVASSALLTSCLAVKDYEQSAVKETEQGFRTSSNQKTDSISMANVSWKKMFTDATLQKYINEALQNNIDMQIAINQMSSAEAYMKQGKMGYLPTLGISASPSRQKISKNSRFGKLSPNATIDQFDFTGTLSWELDIWGKIRSNKRASYASYLKTSTVQQAVKTALVANVAKNYYQLLALDAQLKITNQTIEVRKKGVETITDLQKAGLVTQVAVDQNSAQYNNAEALKIDLETAIFKLENSLSILLGTSPKHLKRGELNTQSIDPEIKIGVPALLLSNRPDVKAAQYGIMEAFELKNVAKTNLYPAFTLTASSGFQSLQFDNWFSTNSLFTNVIAGLTQPIFNQRKLRTQLEVSKNKEEEALLNYRKVLLTASSEVSNALFSYQSETNKFKFRNNEANALSQAESNSEELLNNGYATYLDLLTARQGALTAKLNLADNKLQQLLSIVDLYKALGGGVE